MTARPLRWWDIAVVAVSLMVFAIVLVSDDRAVDRVVVGGTLAVYVGCWFVFARRTLVEAGGRGAHLALLAAVMFVGTIGNPSFSIFQIVALPIAWYCAEGLAASIAANVGIIAAATTGYVLSTRAPVEAIAVGALSLGFSIAMGTWITRITELSAQRQRLIDELTAAQDAVATLSHDRGVAAERERLARDLHDTIAQSLTGIVMLAERAKVRHPDDAALGVLEDAARQALAETRGLVAATAPVELDGGLRAAVAALAARFERETDVAVTARVDVDVPRGLEVVLLRCAQEALANVRKHAVAAHATVSVERFGGEAVLRVVDDGVGFDVAAAGDGFGLAGMRDRVALVGGRLTVSPVEPHGTRLEVVVPIEPARVEASA